MHAVKMPMGYQEEKPTVTRWIKIFTWRANGDGINPFSNGLIEDCFIRTQDDSTYVNGQGIRRVVYWQDSNGSTFVLSPLGGESLNKHPLVVEDCTVIYARAKVGGLVVISQHLTQSGSLSLVDKCRGSSLIGRELPQ